MRWSFGKIVAVLTLAILALWVARPYFERNAIGNGAPPLPVTIQPEGKLSDWEKSSAELFRATAPSVAYIVTASRSFNPLSGTNVAQGAGSGFVWDTDGHIVTNAHVIAKADTVMVQLDAGDPIRARVVGVAPDYDIAVVRLSTTPRNLRPLPLGTSAGLQVGQAAYAIGNPYGLSRTLTTGIVSALERRLPTSRGREVRGVIQTDAAINPGNSGGPLLDSSGRLIGLNTAIYSESGASAGIGFAIPVDLVKRVVPDIIKHGRAPQPGIGIAAADERVASQLGVKGIIVLGVLPGSPAAKAGIQPFRPQQEDGDIIVGLNGKPVETLSDFVAALDAAGVGAEVSLRVRRKDQERDVKLTVADIRG